MKTVTKNWVTRWGDPTTARISVHTGGLTFERDVEVLSRVLNGDKYSEVASACGVSKSYVASLLAVIKQGISRPPTSGSVTLGELRLNRDAVLCCLYEEVPERSESIWAFS